MQLTGPGFANQAPFADDKDVNTDHETQVDITLSGFDPDLDDLTFAVDTDPANGTVTGTPPDVTYEPDAGFGGQDTFTYVADDGELTSAPATVTITVEAGADDDAADDDTADDDTADDDDDDGGGQDCTCRTDGSSTAPLALMALAGLLALLRRSR